MDVKKRRKDARIPVGLSWTQFDLLHRHIEWHLIVYCLLGTYLAQY